jgi:hypothetical protein
VWLNLTMMASSVLVRIAFVVRKGPLDDAIDIVLGLATIVVIIVTVFVYVWRALRSLND